MRKKTVVSHIILIKNLILLRVDVGNSTLISPRIYATSGVGKDAGTLGGISW